MVLEAALALSPEERAKPMSASDESIAKMLTTLISLMPSGMRGSPTPAIRRRLTTGSPRSVSSLLNGLACRLSSRNDGRPDGTIVENYASGCE